MNHPLGKFHRPCFGAGLRDLARGQTSAHRVTAGIRLAGQATFVEGPSGIPRTAKTAPRRRTEVHPTNVVPPSSPEKPRLRWYQYSLRTLFLLTLIVCLFMSWYAVKVKKAMAQKKAVEAILAADGAVAYDFEFDQQGNATKGVKGHGPTWLRDLLGPDYFDTVVHVQVKSAKGMEGVSGLVSLRSLRINVPPGAGDPLRYLQDIDGLEELDISGCVTDAGLDHIRGLRHLRRLTLSWLGPARGLGKENEITGSALAALKSCPALRELIVENCELPAAALGQIETLTQLEKLNISDINSGGPLVFHINKLTALRELVLSNWSNPENASMLDNSMLLFGGIEAIQSLSRLEKLALSSSSLSSSDVKFLCKLPALRELDLSDCSKTDDAAVPYLQKMTGLRRLTLEKTGISDEGAERIDDALPNCRVIYGVVQ